VGREFKYCEVLGCVGFPVEGLLSVENGEQVSVRLLQGVWLYGTSGGGIAAAGGYSTK
jgi:hypothetical protein